MRLLHSLVALNLAQIQRESDHPAKVWCDIVIVDGIPNVFGGPLDATRPKYLSHVPRDEGSLCSVLRAKLLCEFGSLLT